MPRLKVGIIVGSTRPGRKGRLVADWVHRIASQRDDADYELLDIADFSLPLLDEPRPPAMGEYLHEHAKRWAAQIDGCDAFVFVTPEYNHAACRLGRRPAYAAPRLGLFLGDRTRRQSVTLARPAAQTWD